MNKLKDQGLKAIAIKAARGEASTNYSNKDLSDTIRKQMIEVLGTDKIDYKTFRRHGADVYEFVEETIAPVVNDRLQEVFGRFAEHKNIALGDQNKFFIEDINLFPIATISAGNGNVLRHRLENQELTVPTHWVGAGVTEELIRFLAGRIDWAKLVARLTESFTHDMYKRISEALYGSVSTLGNTYSAKVSATSNDVKTKLLEIADHVEAANGQAVIVGTKAALRKLKPEDVSDAEKGAKNAVGYFGHVDGYETLALPQFHKAGTDEFGVKNDVIFVLPSSDEKIIKTVSSGTYIAREESGYETYRTDMQMNFDVITEFGVAVITGAKYGAIELEK